MQGIPGLSIIGPPGVQGLPGLSIIGQKGAPGLAGLPGMYRFDLNHFKGVKNISLYVCLAFIGLNGPPGIGILSFSNEKDMREVRRDKYIFPSLFSNMILLIEELTFFRTF